MEVDVVDGVEIVIAVIAELRDGVGCHHHYIPHLFVVEVAEGLGG